MDYYRRNELPETVHRYKTYTNSFQEWLLKTAINRNIEHAAHIAEQAKTKKKRDKRSYKISVDQQERLVNAIAETQAPLTDTSGLLDLDDAIRSRKEIAQYHKLTRTQDAGHAFFNGALEGFRTKLAAIISLVPTIRQTHDLPDEISTYIHVYFSKDECDQSDEEPEVQESSNSKGSAQHRKAQINARTKSKVEVTEIPLTANEAKLHHNYLVLYFLHEFNRIRDIIRNAWVQFHHGSINAATAALVTDFALSHIQQSTAALCEDLIDDEGVRQRTPTEIVQELYDEMTTSSARANADPASPQISDQALRQLFGINAISQFEAYLVTAHHHPGKSSQGPSSAKPFYPFLGFFDVISKKAIKLPLWDKFSEDMLLRSDGSNSWLPFGFQIILDIQEVVRADYGKLFSDSTEHGFDIARMMRVHVEYEDHMWAIGKKPDYMAQGVMKFSSVFLQPLDSLLGWIQELLKTGNTSDASGIMNIGVFIAFHPTLAGLAMSYYSRLYQSISIAKVQWFLTSLAHLYNAARQVGGLDLVWPDLDFIIKMHGARRIFVGDPPNDPKHLENRHLLAMCTSTRYFAPDSRHKGSLAPLARPEIREKHGLMSHFPLEERIRAYYGPDRKNNRWVKRHAVLNYLSKLAKATTQVASFEQEADHERHEELQSTFTSLVARISPPSNKGTKLDPRVQQPDFRMMDDTYAPLLLCMQSELQTHELHSHFDYLSLYRRGFALALRIREEVLFDANMQIARRGDLDQSPDPDNISLITDLFAGLKIKPKNEKIKTTGSEVSTDVVPLDQLKSIAEIMRSVIQREGSVELDRATLRSKRDWSALKASYDAEESGELDTEVETGISLPLDLQRHDEPEPTALTVGTSLGEERKVKEVEELSGSEHILNDLPPGHWPEELDEDLGDFREESSAVVATSEAADIDQTRECDRKAQNGGQEAHIHSYLFNDFLDNFSPQLDDESCDGSDICYRDSELEPTESIATTRAESDEHPISIRLGANVPNKNEYQAYVTDEVDEDSRWVTNSYEQPIVKEQTIDVDNPNPQETHDHTAPIPEQDELGKYESGGLISEPNHVVQKPAHEQTSTGKPKGIFHRVTFSSTLSRKRALRIKRTSSSACLGYKTLPRGSRGHLAGTARKHAVSMKCYALCAMARALLGKKSRFQRRLSTATGILSTGTLLTKQSCTPLAREIAWQAALEDTSGNDVGEEGWELDIWELGGCKR